MFFTNISYIAAIKSIFNFFLLLIDIILQNNNLILK
jgi:hypothetical protein